MLGVRVRERHRHVEVGDAGLEGGFEDLLVEAGVGRVEHGVGSHAGDQRGHVRLVGGVHPLGPEAVGLAQALGGRPRPLERDVGHHDLRERGPALGDRGERRAHAAGAHHQDLHRSGSPAQVLHGRWSLAYAAAIRAAEDKPTFSAGVPSPPSSPPPSAGIPAPPPESGQRHAAAAGPCPKPRAGTALGALARAPRHASCCSPRSPAWRSRCSRPGRWSCTCPAASPRTSATPSAPPGRSPGWATRCSTTPCTCGTRTPSTPTP